MTRPPMSRQELIDLLSVTDPLDIESVRARAEEVLIQHCGRTVFMRGLVEASNICRCDCHYCGIRKSNTAVHRYQLDTEALLDVARQCVALGYGSMVIQTGERRDDAFVRWIEGAITAIKNATQSPSLPHGLGLTLSLGEQSHETYRRWFDAGAHRYLLRIETSNPDLFARLHPRNQSYAERRACLGHLRDIGYQVGTGVMIGLPGQSLADLADDILFYRDLDCDMIGMGPYIPHPQTPMAEMDVPPADQRLHWGLMMIAVTRLALSDVNIAATTALQALSPTGREDALRYGANVMMPLLTPSAVRQDYLLYPGKPVVIEGDAAYRATLDAWIAKAGRVRGIDVWGDAPHAKARRG